MANRRQAADDEAARGVRETNDDSLRLLVSRRPAGREPSYSGLSDRRRYAYWPTKSQLARHDPRHATPPAMDARLSDRARAGGASFPRQLQGAWPDQGAGGSHSRDAWLGERLVREVPYLGRCAPAATKRDRRYRHHGVDERSG